MAKRNPYLKVFSEGLKVFDQNAFTIDELVAYRGEGRTPTSAWVQRHIDSGEFEKVNKKSRTGKTIAAYRPKA